MLTIILDGIESFDDETEVFTIEGGIPLQFEHSLASLSKWESQFEKPFLSGKEKTTEEALAYIEAMLVTQNPPGDFLHRLSTENFSELSAYMDSKQTATWFNDRPAKPSREVITAELIYYWMISFQIPFECQYWHLNRLFTLLRVCELKSAKPKNMSRREIAERNRALNAQRKAQLGTTG